LWVAMVAVLSSWGLPWQQCYLLVGCHGRSVIFLWIAMAAVLSSCRLPWPQCYLPVGCHGNSVIFLDRI